MFKIPHFVHTIFEGDSMRDFIYNFKTRSCLCLILSLTLLFLCAVRVNSVIVETNSFKKTANCIQVEIKSDRGNIYDCNGEKLTGSEKIFTVVFLPCPSAIIRYAQITFGKERAEGLKKLRDNKVVTLNTDEKLSGIGIYSFESDKRYSDDLFLGQFIGYTDINDHGVSGIEKQYDEILFSNEKIKAEFALSAGNDFLLGEDVRCIGGNSGGAVYLTIDKKIQSICVNAAESVEKGAVLVLENRTGKIRGAVSKPGLNVTNLSLEIDDENLPFLNRITENYSVGSVFKPLIAAAMLENGSADFVNDCKGVKSIAGNKFYCNARNGHGNIDLRRGLLYSCNCYFYSAVKTVSPESTIDIAHSLGFGKELYFAKGLKTSSGNMTTLADIKSSDSNIANYSIGQGDILLSPMVLSNLYSSIANDGYYITPQLVEGYTKNGKYYSETCGEKSVVFSKSTASVLKDFLLDVVNYGTGIKARTKDVSVAGKTATAQTGQYIKGHEVLNAWFCGFFPTDTPKYTVVVMVEDANSGSEDAAPVFKKIAEGISSAGFLK